MLHRLILICTLCALLPLGLSSGCRGDPLGKPCKEDSECGPGFDCYPDVCVQVCTTDDECKAGTCYQFHCVEPGTENAVPKFGAKRPPSKKLRAPTKSGPPPIPDATVAELRAIRRELELIRQSHRQILKALKAKGIELPEPALHPEVPVVPTRETDRTE